MAKMRRIIKFNQIYSMIILKCFYCNLGTSLMILMLLLTCFSMESAAADYVISDNPEPDLSADQKVKVASTVSALNSQENISLRQRLLASKKSNAVVQSNSVKINDGLTAAIEPKTFRNSFDGNKFWLESQEQLTNNHNLQQYFVATVINNYNFSLTEQGVKLTDLLQPKQNQILGQIDSSSSVGDTFSTNIDQLRQQFLIEPIVTISEPPKSAPGLSAGTPTAYGASLGQAYFGGGLYFPFDKSKDRNDGSLSLGFGLGNPFNSVGVEVNIDITSVGGGPGFDFGDSGGVGFKLHRYLGNNAAVAVGWSNPIKWGDVNLAEDTFYGVFTRSFFLQPGNPQHNLPLTVSLGLGTGAFRSKGAIEADENSINFFAGLGVRLFPQVSLVSSWTGSILNIGASFAPFKNTPIVINAIIADVTENLDTGSGLAVTAGYSFEF